MRAVSGGDARAWSGVWQPRSAASRAAAAHGARPVTSRRSYPGWRRCPANAAAVRLEAAPSAASRRCRAACCASGLGGSGPSVLPMRTCFTRRLRGACGRRARVAQYAGQPPDIDRYEKEMQRQDRDQARQPSVGDECGIGGKSRHAQSQAVGTGEGPQGQSGRDPAQYRDRCVDRGHGLARHLECRVRGMAEEAFKKGAAGLPFWRA